MKSRGPATRKERIAWLRSTHGIGLPTAMVIASETEGENMAAVYDDHDGLVDAMYRGKENLRPIYETVAKAVKKLGKDVELLARKGYVTVARKRQFAALQPSTKSRLDLGLENRIGGWAQIAARRLRGHARGYARTDRGLPRADS